MSRAVSEKYQLLDQASCPTVRFARYILGWNEKGESPGSGARDLRVSWSTPTISHTDETYEIAVPLS